jgi:hypothetical protein
MHSDDDIQVSVPKAIIQKLRDIRDQQDTHPIIKDLD